MQPTMKIRLLKVSSAQRGQPFSTDNYGNSYILQQWWEGTKLKQEYEHFLPGSWIPYSGQIPPVFYESYGEWRDIPIELDNA